MNAQWVALPAHTGHVVFQTRHWSRESCVAVRSSATGTALVVKSILSKGKQRQLKCVVFGCRVYTAGSCPVISLTKNVTSTTNDNE